jgi:periplasmic protein TonB
MADTAQPANDRPDSSAGHLSLRIDGRVEPQFQFALQPRRLTFAFLSSLLVQAGILALVIFAGRLGLRAVGVLPERPPEMVFLPVDGLGGGGGGGGNEMKEPPKKAEIPKPKTVSIEPIQPKIDPAPVPRFDIPVTTLAQVELPGAMQAPAGLPTVSQGSGRGGGGGTGVGSGVGPGTGSGLGPGSGGNTGGGPKRPGNGVKEPVPIFNPDPVYTGDAMRAHIEGEVWVECTVTTAGVCSDIHIVHSLDPKFGLDQEAINTVSRWRFRPGTFESKPVSVIVIIQVGFSLR